jgi:hypothetical protein
MVVAVGPLCGSIVTYVLDLEAIVVVIDVVVVVVNPSTSEEE